MQLKMYQGKIAKHLNKRVKSRTFEVGDLVLRRVFPATQDPRVGFLAPNWEGPYDFKEKMGPWDVPHKKTRQIQTLAHLERGAPSPLLTIGPRLSSRKSLVYEVRCKM